MFAVIIFCFSPTKSNFCCVFFLKLLLCRASSVKHRKDFAITCWPPEKLFAHTHAPTKENKASSGVLTAYCSQRFYCTYKKGEELSTLADSAGGGGSFTERFKCYKMFHEQVIRAALSEGTTSVKGKYYCVLFKSFSRHPFESKITFNQQFQLRFGNRKSYNSG